MGPDRHVGGDPTGPRPRETMDTGAHGPAAAPEWLLPRPSPEHTGQLLASGPAPHHRRGEIMKRMVLIPAYNEEHTIPLVIRDVRGYCQDIVVVDDGSTDFTGAVARDEGAMVIPHGQNKGYAEALRTGYRYALEQNYDGIVQIDADGQHDPAHIPELFNRG